MAKSIAEKEKELIEDVAFESAIVNEGILDRANTGETMTTGETIQQVLTDIAEENPTHESLNDQREKDPQSIGEGITDDVTKALLDLQSGSKGMKRKILASKKIVQKK